MFSFLNGAMAAGTQRFLTFEIGGDNDLVKLHKIFATGVNIHFLIAVFVIVLAETIGLWFVNHKMIIPEERMHAAMWVYQFSILSAAVMFFNVPYIAVVVAHERMNVFAYISIVEAVMKLVIVYMLYIVSKVDKLVLYGLLVLLVQVLVQMIYRIYCKRHFREAKYRLIFDSKLFQEMLSFSAWNLWGSVASISMTQGVNILLNVFFGPAVNAARGIAAQVQGIVVQFASNFQMALNPQIIKSYASGEMGYMYGLVFRSCRFSFCLLFCICLPLFIEADALLGIWLKDVPLYSVPFLRLILCSAILQSVAAPLMTSAQATGKIRLYQSAIGGILLVVLPVAYWVLKLGGAPFSVFVVEVFICAIAFVARVYLVHKMIGLSLYVFFRNVIVRCFLVVVIASILPTILAKLLADSIVSSVLICFVSMISACFSSLFVGMTAIERDFVIQNLKMKILRHR